MNYEMFFYAILAASPVFKRLSIPTAICLILSIGLLSKLPTPLAQFYYFNEIILEFAAGLAVGLSIKSGYRPTRAEAALYLSTSLVLFYVHNQFRSEGVMAWGPPCILMVLGALGLESTHAIRGKLVQLLGKARYSIYLFHALAIWTISWIWTTTPGTGAVASAIALSVFGGVLSYWLIEKHLLSWMLRRI